MAGAYKFIHTAMTSCGNLFPSARTLSSNMRTRLSSLRKEKEEGGGGTTQKNNTHKHAMKGTSLSCKQNHREKSTHTGENQTSQNPNSCFVAKATRWESVENQGLQAHLFLGDVLSHCIFREKELSGVQLMKTFIFLVNQKIFNTKGEGKEFICPGLLLRQDIYRWTLLLCARESSEGGNAIPKEGRRSS